MSNPTELICWNLAVVAGMMLGMWLISLVKRDASVVDPFWGFGFVVLAWSTLFQVPQPGSRAWLLVAMVTLWGLRLSSYLLIRNWGEPEDKRYAKMREKHGERFGWVSLFTVFAVQGLIMWIVSLPVQAGVYATNGLLGALDAVGVVVWLVGIFFESVGDLQMARFKSRPDSSGKVMDRGLWRYTRHPNYFGDFCVWWGLYLMAAASGAWWTLPSPLLMSFLLLKVSGVKLLEKDIEERRPEYQAYKRRTNAFFPGPPDSDDLTDSRQIPN